MPDAASSNAIFGLFGPIAILALLGLNAMLIWARRRSFADALLGRGLAGEIRFVAPGGDPQNAESNVVPISRERPIRRAAPALAVPLAA